MRRGGIDEERLQNARILIIDDQEANVTLLQAMLGRAGYRSVDALTDPSLAVGRVLDTSPDLILLDLHMPGLDGLALLRRLSTVPIRGAYVPIIVLTADVDRAVRQEVLSLGAEDFLTKPFDIGEVLVRCRNLLETGFLHADLEARNRMLASEVEEGGRELKRQHDAYAAITSSLRGLEPGGDAVTAAGMFCHRLSELPDIDAAGIIAFGTDSGAYALATAGSPGVGSLAGRPLPLDRAERLIARAQVGAWAEDFGPSRNGWEETLLDAGLRSGIWAPVEVDGEILGVLGVASASQHAAAFARLLPRVVDFAAIARVVVGPALRTTRQAARSGDVISRLINERAFEPVFQPIVALEDRRVLGYEALTRFQDGVPPDRRFADAEAVGLGLALEEACLRAAVSASEALPASAWLSLNVSPEAMLSQAILADVVEPARRLIVFEVTEHSQIEDYGRFRDALSRFSGTVRLAIDDAGAGFASFRHIVELRPDYVKIDIGLVRSIQDDPMRQALVTGLRYFSTKTGCTLIAEGIETEAECAALQDLGVTFGQGYLLGRPVPLGEARVDSPSAAQHGPDGLSRRPSMTRRVRV